jgi:hypothetical protein
MSKMYPKQAVEIVRKLLKKSPGDSPQSPLAMLSRRQRRAITFLADFVDEVRQARDLVQVIDRLFDEGIIYTEPGEPQNTRKEVAAP